MTVRVHVICDFCRRQSPGYNSSGRAITDLLNNLGWTLMVIKRKTHHRCTQCTRTGLTEIVEVKP